MILLTLLLWFVGAGIVFVASIDESQVNYRGRIRFWTFAAVGCIIYMAGWVTFPW